MSDATNSSKVVVTTNNDDDKGYNELDMRLRTVMANSVAVTSALNSILACMTEGFNKLQSEVASLRVTVDSLSERLDTVDSTTRSIVGVMSTNDAQMNDRISHLHREVIDARSDVASKVGSGNPIIDSVNSHPSRHQPSHVSLTAKPALSYLSGPSQVSDVVSERARIPSFRPQSRAVSSPSHQVSSDRDTSSSGSSGTQSSDSTQEDNQDASTHANITSRKFKMPRSQTLQDPRIGMRTLVGSGMSAFSSVEDCNTYYGNSVPYLQNAIHGIVYCVVSRVKHVTGINIVVDGELSKVLNKYIAIAKNVTGTTFSVTKNTHSIFKSSMLLYEYGRIKKNNMDPTKIIMDIQPSIVASAINSVPELGPTVCLIMKLLFNFISFVEKYNDTLTAKYGFNMMCMTTRRIGIILKHLPPYGVIEPTSIRMLNFTLSNDEIEACVDSLTPSHMSNPTELVNKTVKHVFQHVRNKNYQAR